MEIMGNKLTFFELSSAPRNFYKFDESFVYIFKSRIFKWYMRPLWDLTKYWRKTLKTAYVRVPCISFVSLMMIISVSAAVLSLLHPCELILLNHVTKIVKTWASLFVNVLTYIIAIIYRKGVQTNSTVI